MNRSPLVALALLLFVSPAGCAAWRVFREDVAPVACAALEMPFEARACSAHVAAGLAEQDPRAAALHAAGQAVDALLAADADVSGTDPAILGAALRAFEQALQDVTPGPQASTDGGSPTDPPDPNPSNPSPTLPLPPPILAMVDTR